MSRAARTHTQVQDGEASRLVGMGFKEEVRAQRPTRAISVHERVLAHPTTRSRWWCNASADGCSPAYWQGRIQWLCEAEAEELHLDAEDAEKLLWVATPDEVIFFGIIDILTAYELRKKAEHFFTGTLRCAAVSCQPADK